MKEGFVLDEAPVTRHAARWVPGSPRDSDSVMGGVEVNDRSAISIRAFRCDACGFVELYAPRE